MSKITEEQLKTANENQENLISLVNRIGVIETQKHGLLHDVAEAVSYTHLTLPTTPYV